MDSKSDAIKEAEKLKAKGVKIVSIDLVNSFKDFWAGNSVYNELAMISSPLKPIPSEYGSLNDHVQEVAKLLCSCKFTFKVVLLVVNVVVVVAAVVMMIIMVILVMMVMMMIVVVILVVMMANVENA